MKWSTIFFLLAVACAIAAFIVDKGVPFTVGALYFVWMARSTVIEEHIKEIKDMIKLWKS